MAYDSARGVTVLFGGNAGDPGGGFNGETWEWDGMSWTRRAVTGPSPRDRHSMAYDSGRGVTVLFGGVAAPGNHNGETWEWDGTTWSQRLVPGPSARESAAMAYDQARGVTVLFGGTGNFGTNAETWEWNGTVWLQRSVGGPPARYSHVMAYDSARARTVMYLSTYETDTWDWDGTAWVLRASVGPARRMSAVMAYDSARGVSVLFGGETPLLGALGDTWQWGQGGDQSWRQFAGDAPSARYGAAMAFDESRGVTVLFGGAYRNSNYDPVRNSETWVLGSACSSAEFNHDGVSGDAADVGAFFACLAGTCCPACDSVDFNGDGDTGTDADIEAFFRVLAGGPC